MQIQDISIVNFKNLKEIHIGFSPKLNCFIGKNGAGKTNILDAVYYLSFCKSFSSPVDLLNINHDETYFMLNGNYRCDGWQMSKNIPYETESDSVDVN